ncbi:MAG: helix-turn-helix transcriptional regulator (plasmid) [Candidatus Algichlamydia australiensis]|nr:helix-turn-helix transcriptional regulator [Chlamydiales bacterium]
MKKSKKLTEKQKETLCKTIGSLIREKRKKMGYSQEALGMETDIHRTYIGIIERGESNVTIEMLATIANVLECEIEEFIPSFSVIKK